MKIGGIEDKGDGKAMADLPLHSVMLTIKSTIMTSDGEGKHKMVDLPKGTRVEAKSCHESGRYGIDVVDGSHTGKHGYVNGTVLINEK